MSEAGGQRWQYLRPLLVVLGIALLLGISFFFWQVFHAVLLLFAAVLFAVLLDGLARLVEGRLRTPRLVSLLLVLAVLAGVGTAFGFLAGPSISNQIDVLSKQLPEAVEQLQGRLQGYDWGEAVLETVPNAEEIVPSFSSLLSRVSLVFTTTLGAMANIVIILVVGFYLALEPRLYTRGFLKLVPAVRRDRAREVIGTLGHALRWWLLGRFAAMAAVGALTALVLWLVGMPLALALGFIAGLLTFVPFIGPIAAAIPAVLIAFVQDGSLMSGYVILIYTGVQFLEGNFITPIVQKYSVSLPPALLITAQFLLGIQFGLVGVLLATPITVAGIVIVQMLYVQDVIGEDVVVLGEHHKRTLDRPAGE